MQRLATYITILLLLLTSCGKKIQNNESNGAAGDTLKLLHSSLLQIVEYDDYTLVNIRNPWKKNRYLHRYMLLPKGSEEKAVPNGMTLLRTPLDKQLIFTTLHAELFIMLDCFDALSGVCDARYMSIPAVKQSIAKGDIVDCGSSMDVNLEKLIELSPEAAWVVPFKNGGYGKMERVDIPLVECGDYMETSPLGAAEWIRFYGRLLGVEERADSIFFTVCKRYEELKRLAGNANYRPRLMCELKNGAAWYMPGGHSTMGKIYSDAGADYIFGDNDESGSLPFSFEAVLSKADSADIWLIKYGADKDKSYSSLQDEFQGYTLLRPYRNREIYGCNVSKHRFYEETPFRPDILLEELVMLFHPELNDGYKFRYYEKLKE